MDISNTEWLAMSDTALAQTIGAFVKHHRLTQNRTQQQIADAIFLYQLAALGPHRQQPICFTPGLRTGISHEHIFQHPFWSPAFKHP